MKALKTVFALALVLVMVFGSVPFTSAKDSTDSPLLFEGETLFGGWAFQLLNVDGNEIDDRISFVNVTTTPDTNEVITARLAIEFDYGTETEKEPIFIERVGGDPVHPRLQCVNKYGETLIIIKNPCFGGSISEERLYAFVYSDGVLNEIFTNEQNEFPENSIVKLPCFDNSNFGFEWKNDTTFELWYGEGEKSEFTISEETFNYEHFDSEYGFKLWFDANKLEFDPAACTITAITYGSISDPEANYEGVDFTPVMVKMILNYSETAFVLDSVEFIDSSLMHRVTFRSKLAGNHSWQYVKDGEDAIPPILNDVEGYYFAGWDKPYTNITESVDIRAIYWKYGDVNMDKHVNTGDATAILNYLVDLNELDDTQLILADMNSDDLVNTGDAIMILLNIVDE